MEKLTRPNLQDIQTLADYAGELELRSAQCAQGIRHWIFSDKLYRLLKEALSEMSNKHCSFCDGFPLNDTSKETIEHYYPKSEFPEKTYDWNNLYLCCDKCQSEANKDKAFRISLMPDAPDYHFDQHFYFDPETGNIEVLEILQVENVELYLRATKFLERYGINASIDRKSNRKRRYADLVQKLKLPDHFPDLNRGDEPYRFLYDLAIEVIAPKQ